MTIEELKNDGITIIGRNGNPLTKKEREFLITIKEFEKCYGTNVLLPFRLFLELILEKTQK